MRPHLGFGVSAVEPCSCREEVLSELGRDSRCGWAGVELPTSDVADGAGPGLEADGVGGLVAEEVHEPEGPVGDQFVGRPLDLASCCSVGKLCLVLVDASLVEERSPFGGCCVDCSGVLIEPPPGWRGKLSGSGVVGVEFEFGPGQAAFGRPAGR